MGNVSDPIVPFRETIVTPPKTDMLNEEISDLNKSTAHHSQRLPTFMLREIQSCVNVHNVDDMDKENADKELADTEEVQLSKLQISEQRKTEKLREKLGLI